MMSAIASRLTPRRASMSTAACASTATTCPSLRPPLTFIFTGEPVGVASVQLAHGPPESPGQVRLRHVGEAAEDEQEIPHFLLQIPFGLVMALTLLPVTVIDLPGQLAHLFGQAGQERQGMPVAFLELTDPMVHFLLGLAYVQSDPSRATVPVLAPFAVSREHPLSRAGAPP